MKNEPQFLIIGNGKVARHFTHYLNQLGVSFSSWDRRFPDFTLQQQLRHATHVLVLISDRAVEAFYRQHLLSTTAQVIHFSGALEIEGIKSTHPLQTFGETLYPLEDYKKIPFILTEGNHFDSLLPGLPNPFFTIKKEDKPYYHALCVMGGNFTTLLWQHVFEKFKVMGLPPDVAWPFLEQTIKNIQRNNQNALTGPLQRKDKITVQKNLQALQADSYREIYKSFVEVHFPEGLTS